MKIKIAKKSLLESAPILIKIKTERYILSKNSEGHPVLFSADCPHQHGIVEDLKQNSLTCPLHNWSFNPKSGQSFNAPQESLQSFSVSIEKNDLFADLPENKNNLILPINNKKIFPKITLVSNACLLIESDGKVILTDPWIIGPALYGSWIQYPPTTLKLKDLPKLDFIIISHEHSDHFNEKTLSMMDKNIPIYLPHYDNGRLSERVKKLGFKNVFSVASDKIVSLSDNIKLIFFYSNSLWNDSIIYLQIGNFKILNVNDAGFNWNIPKIVGDIDLLCSAFSFGASSYPLNWTHLDISTKIEIMERKNLGMFKMLKQISNLCNAKYILPFANFNELGPIKLRNIAKLQIKNTPRTIKKYFENDSLKVLEMFPGESWDSQHDKILERVDHEEFFDRKNTLKYLDSEISDSINLEYIPNEFTLVHNDLKKYFEEFSNSQITKQIGNYSILLIAANDRRKLSAKISFIEGIIEYESEPEDVNVDMSMMCPGGILQDIIKRDLSWDEISYWSEYSRKNDEYNIGIWKLMHTPWNARKHNKVKSNLVNKNTSIAYLLEKGGKEVNSVFEEFGLYCAACDASIGENIEEGCKMHGLTEDLTQQLISKINNIFQKSI